MITGTQFLLFYTVFVFFFVLVTTLGAPTFLPEEGKKELEKMYAPTVEAPEEVPENGAWYDKILDFFRAIYNFFKFVYKGIKTFYILLKFSSSVRWITLLIIIPYTVTLAYVLWGLIPTIGGR